MDSPVPTANLLSPSPLLFAFSEARRGSLAFPMLFKLVELTLLEDDLLSLAVEGSIIDAAPAPRSDCDLPTELDFEDEEGVPSPVRPPRTRDKNILLIL